MTNGGMGGIYKHQINSQNGGMGGICGISKKKAIFYDGLVV